eukprot:6486582-Amphidinium_carterae.4
MSKPYVHHHQIWKDRVLSLSATLTCHDLQDDPWAEYEVLPNTSAEVAVGDSCAKCKQLHERCVHTQGLSWEQFAEKYKSDAAVKAAAEAASTVISGEKQKGWLERSVASSLRVWLEFQKSWIALTGAELKKELGITTKLTNAHVAGIPKITAPAADDSLTDFYLFAHPEHPWRTCVLKSADEIQLKTENMKRADHMYEKQADDIFLSSWKQELDQSGAASLLNKESTLMSLKTFLGQKAVEKFRAGTLLGAGEEEENEDPSAQADIGEGSMHLTSTVSASSIQVPSNVLMSTPVSMRRSPTADSIGSSSNAILPSITPRSLFPSPAEPSLPNASDVASQSDLGTAVSLDLVDDGLLSSIYWDVGRDKKREVVPACLGESVEAKLLRRNSEERCACLEV